MEEDIRISGTPIRVIAIILAIASVIGGITVYQGIGAILGAIIGVVNGIFLYAFSTIVDACYKYLKQK